MTFDEAKKVVKEFQFGWPLKAFDPWLVLHHEMILPGVQLSFGLRTPERDTGSVGEGVKCLSFYTYGFFEKATVRDWQKIIRQNFVEMLIHELDESIQVNGVRIFDPHAEVSK